jgi:hypothetical protein
VFETDDNRDHGTNSDTNSFGIAIAVAGKNDQIAFSGLKIRQSRVRDVWDGYVFIPAGLASEEFIMEGPLRGCLAGVAAWKWGGGCLSTIIIFIIVYLLLGHVKC